MSSLLAYFDNQTRAVLEVYKPCLTQSQVQERSRAIVNKIYAIILLTVPELTMELDERSRQFYENRAKEVFVQYVYKFCVNGSHRIENF